MAADTQAIDADEDDEGETSDDLEDAEAKEEMISFVENIALRSKVLLGAEEYQHLRNKGFYVTRVRWKAQQKNDPFDVIEFEAGFDQPREGTGFRYNPRGAYRNRNGRLTSTIRALTKEERGLLLALLEQTARSILTTLRDDPLSEDA